MDHFLPFGQRYLERKKPVIFYGDINICHKPIDIHNPTRLKNTSGFLPEERLWITNLLDAGFEDAYRCLLRVEPNLYGWWSYRAASKKRNKGWRIDHITSPELLDKAKKRSLKKSGISPTTPQLRLSINYNIIVVKRIASLPVFLGEIRTGLYFKALH